MVWLSSTKLTHSSLASGANVIHLLPVIALMHIQSQTHRLSDGQQSQTDPSL